MSNEHVSPTPLTRWQQNESNQIQLAEFLASPVGQDLTNVLRYLASPTSPVPPGSQGEEPIAARALQYSELVGYHNALNNLQALTNPRVVTQEVPKPWRGTRFQSEQ
jgi:hypothetical protein|tara:strand:+ start:18290 stop:18610 length:321 start_codon:yes stop_codon:yes gene_type:complete